MIMLTATIKKRLAISILFLPISVQADSEYDIQRYQSVANQYLTAVHLMNQLADSICGTTLGGGPTIEKTKQLLQKYTAKVDRAGFQRQQTGPAMKQAFAGNIRFISEFLDRGFYDGSDDETLCKLLIESSVEQLQTAKSVWQDAVIRYSATELLCSISAKAFTDKHGAVSVTYPEASSFIMNRASSDITKSLDLSSEHGNQAKVHYPDASNGLFRIAITVDANAEYAVFQTDWFGAHPDFPFIFRKQPGELYSGNCSAT